MKLYDRIRSDDAYVRVYALIELARLRERAQHAEALADALGRMLAGAAIVMAKKGEYSAVVFEECRAVRGRYVEFNQKEVP